MQSLSQDTIRTTLLEALEAAAPAHGVDIVDVEVVGSEKALTVRVRIDNADEESQGISLEEVSAQSGWVSELIDEIDPIDGSYMLEVSSPGLARPLRRPQDFERFAGNTVALKTKAKEGRRRYTGTLNGFEEGNVVIECDGEQFQIPLSNVGSCKIKPFFDDSAKQGGKQSRRSRAGKR